MPELPEVESTRRYLLESGLQGRRFTGVDTRWAKAVKKPSLEDFVLGLQGGRIEDVQRRAKYILLLLDNQLTFILHLGMTGGLVLGDRLQESPPMVRHLFNLDDGRELRFLDYRKFGKMWLVDDRAGVLPDLSPEPLTEDFTAEFLARRLKGRKAPVKALLLEQGNVAGLGNLYSDEALYLSGINPMRGASSLSGEEVASLREGIVAALTNAVAYYDRARADSVRDLPLSLTTWSIPRQAGAKCPRCGETISVTRVRGRGTYFCPACQPE